MKAQVRRAILKRAIGYPALVALAVAALWAVSIRMPGASHTGPLPPMTPAELESRDHLRNHVEALAGRIGERNHVRQHTLDSAAVHVERALTALGYDVVRHDYTARGGTFRNLEATLPGTRRPGELIVIGSHYDSVEDSPGADDNASGTAGMLELARILRDRRPERSIRFIAFANEEPPWFFTDDMGSRRYARLARQRGDSIVAMLSIETIGYYSDSAGSQRYPPILGWFYPDRGDFIGIVGNIASRSLVRDVVRSFRSHTAFPSQGSAAPTQIPGISWSDQWSFWQEGYPAVMITDTAPFRNDHYHTRGDQPHTLDYEKMARVVHGIARTVAELAAATT